jgi:hypothetical protein
MIQFFIIYFVGVLSGFWIMEDFYIYGDNKQKDNKAETDKGKV